MEHYAWTVALTRMISAVFRRGGDVSFVVEELKAVFDPRGGQWMAGRYVPVAAGRDRRRDRAAPGRDRLPGAHRVARLLIDAIEERMRFASGGGDGAHGSPGAGAAARGLLDGTVSSVRQRSPHATRRGCDVCLNCGYSRCG